MAALSLLLSNKNTLHLPYIRFSINSASVDSPIFPYPALRIPHFPSHLLPNPYGYERHENKIRTKFNSIVAALNAWWHTSYSAYVLHHCSRLAKHFFIWSHQKWHLIERRPSSWNKRIFREEALFRRRLLHPLIIYGYSQGGYTQHTWQGGGEVQQIFILQTQKRHFA